MTAHEMTAHEVSTNDGRTLHVVAGGDPDGVLVVLHHGTPGGPLLDPTWSADARDCGLRLVTYARPGYAGSTRHSGRSVAGAAADTAAIADHFAADRLLTWGFSGGGPHALACAALLPDRVVAAATLASIAPYDGDGLDFLAGMGEGNIEEFGKVAGGEQTLRPYLDAQIPDLISSTVDDFVSAMAPFLTSVDAQALTGPIAGTLLGQMRLGCRDGADGWVDDDLAFVRPWGFDLAAITTPVLLWQGRADAMVPYAHGQWLAEHIPGVTARLSEEDGHVTLVGCRVPETHRWLRERWDAV